MRESPVQLVFRRLLWSTDANFGDCSPTKGAGGDGERYQHRGPDQAFRARGRPRRADHRGRSGRGHGVSGPERGGQDHDHPPAARPVAPQRRPGRRVRPRHPAPDRRGASPARLRPGRGQSVAAAHRGRDPACARPDPGAGRHRLPRRAGGALRARPLHEGTGLLEGQPPEGGADRRAHDTGRPADPRRADLGARPAHGAGLPRLRARGQGARAKRVPVLAHSERGGGPVRPGGHSARRAFGRAGHARPNAPPLRRLGRRHVFGGPARPLGRAGGERRAHARARRQPRAARARWRRWCASWPRRTSPRC